MTLAVTEPQSGISHTPPTRRAVLDRILNDPRLPTPPAVAMQIVNVTSRADCEVNDVVELLASDPVICGQVLKVINSCVYGLSRSVTSVERAVVLLGLNTVRSIVLTFSLPAMQLSSMPDNTFRNHCLSSVSGAILARELSVRARVPFAEDDMVCGLLRDLGGLLLRHHHPVEYERYDRSRRERPFGTQCAVERELFGVDHAEVSAELLRKWNLPAELVEPIRFHHEPTRCPASPPGMARRAELIGFVEGLTNLDTIAAEPAELDRLLAHASDRHGMSREELVEFMRGVLPKVMTFADLLKLDIGACPDYAAVLNAGCNELAMLAVQSGRIGIAALDRSHAPPAGGTQFGRSPVAVPEPAGEPAPADALPEFRPQFLDAFPDGGCELDGYRLDRVLGRGAMGVVFRGYERTLDRHVAVKMMLPALALDENARQRFVREVRSAAAIRHENVVSVYTVREANGVVYLAMEYVDGESLEDRLTREGKLPVPDVLRVTAQVLAGLEAAHAKGIIHRDVKPANVLIERTTGAVKLTDFGLARVETDVTLSSGCHLIGTPLYMSPEQIHGLPTDPRSDLFSVGSLLYTLATGVHPFDAKTTFGVLTNVTEKEPQPVRTRRPDAPAWFDPFVARLLAKDPAARYQSAADALSDVNKAAPASGRQGGWKKWLGL